MLKAQLVKKSVSNPAIIYMLSRYGTYIIQFVNSMFIAVYLGPYYLGIWGFINLIIGYIGQINFGISQSVNVLVSVNKQDEAYSKKIINNGMSLMLILSLLIAVFFGFIYFYRIEMGEKYEFTQFILPVILLTMISHITSYLSGFFRIYGHILSIAVYQSIYPILVLLVIPFFRGIELVWAMLIVNIFSFLLALVYFILKSPVKLGIQFEWDTVKFIQKKGWHLFVYGASFYLIILTTNAFISGNYEVEEFGYYTFSYSLANVVLLLLNSISFLVFPKMLNRFASSTNVEVQQLLSSVRAAFISLSHLLIHSVILLYPVFIYFFSQYESTVEVFRLTALTVVLYTNSFGYQGYLMAKGEEKKIALVAFSALIMNIVLCYIMINFFNVPFSMVILATMLTYFFYVHVSAKLGRKKLELKDDFINTLKDVFPIRMMLPFAVSIILIFLEANNWLFVIPIILFAGLNFKDLRTVKDIVIRLIKNPNFVNI